VKEILDALVAEMLEQKVRLDEALEEFERRECLDHVIVFGEESLRRRLRSYFRYYHGTRLHLSLDKDSPDARPTQTVGRVVAIPQVGGLHHRYERRVA
jgi:hypothetical protein